MGLSPYLQNSFTFSLTTLTGLATLASGYRPFPKDLEDSCIASQDLLDQVHPREERLQELLSPTFYEKWFGTPEKPQEYVAFDKDSLKEKFLFLSAAEDHNSALDPKHILELLKEINKKYDLKYKVVSSDKDVCWHVDKASKIGKLTNLVIHAHSDSQGMCLSNCESTNGWLHTLKNYTKCFENLDLLGRITLFGSKAGISSNDNKNDNIAQKITMDAQREVIAPIDYISSPGVVVSNTKNFELYQKAGTNKEDQKIFKLFQPVFEKCTKLPNSLHQREKEVADIVKKTIKESFLIYPEEFENHILKLCKDNPKQKFLFLSAEDDWNGGLKPEVNGDFFITLSKLYDFKFKVVYSYDEICKEARDASSIGELVNLVIHIHGNRKGAHISGNVNNINNWIYMDRDYSCLRDLPSSVKITLISCNTGMPNDYGDVNDNIASNLAKKTGKLVVAPIDKCTLAEIKGFENSFVITHAPINKDIKEENIFKTFNPERVL